MLETSTRPLDVTRAERDTPAYKVFHWLFEVMLPTAYAIPEADITTFGTVTSGNRKLDIENANDLTHTYRTISQLTKLFDQGCKIILVNPGRDSVKIYNLVQLLLKDWADDFNAGFNIHLNTEKETARMQAVITDIELLENFCAIMYPAAKRVMPNITKSNSLAAKLATFSNFKLKFSEQQSSNTPPTLGKTAPSPFTDNLTNVAKQRVRSWANKE